MNSNKIVFAQTPVPPVDLKNQIIDIPENSGEPLVLAFGTTTNVWIILALTASVMFFGLLFYRLQTKIFNISFDRKLLLKAFDKALGSKDDDTL